MKAKWITTLLLACMLLTLFAGCASTPTEMPGQPNVAAPDVTEETKTPAETSKEPEQPAETPDDTVDSEPAVETKAADVAAAAAEFIKTRTQEADIAHVASGFQNYPNQVNLPLAKETTTLKTWFGWGDPYNVLLTTPNDTPAQQKAEELTNVHIEWELAVDPETQFSLMTASGDYPDMAAKGFGQSGLGKLAEQDIILDLTDTIAAYAPNYQAVRNSDIDFARQTMMDDGSLLAFYGMMTMPGSSFMANITLADWLESFGREVITYDDYYDLLQYYRDVLKVPVPLNIATNGQDDSFMQGFDIGIDWIAVNGKVVHSITQPGYREYVELMRKWYEEDLIEKDFYGRVAWDAGVMFDYDGMAARQYGVWEGCTPFFATIESFSDDPNFAVTAMHLPVKKAGDTRKIALQYVSPSRVDTRHTVIFSSCKNVELAVKYCDFWYTVDGAMLAVYGTENEGYYYDDNHIPQLTDPILHPAEGISSNMARLQYVAESWPTIVDQSRDLKAGMTDNGVMSMEIWDYNWVDSLTMPTLALTAEEAEDYAAKMSDITTRIDESIVRFIIGEKSMDEWDGFVEELRLMGLDEAQAIYQAAYDRYLAR